MGKVLLPSPSCFLIFDVVVHNPRSWLVGWVQNVEPLSIIRCSDSAQSEQSVGYVVDGERLVDGCPQSSDDVWMPLLIGVGAPNHERDVELIFSTDCCTWASTFGPATVDSRRFPLRDPNNRPARSSCLCSV